MGRLVQPHSDRPTQEPKVGQMLELHKRRAQAPEGSAERAEVERRIQQVDREIDELGYELYGVTEKELQSIESKSWEGSGMTERGESSQHQPWEAVGAFVGNHSQADCEYNRSVSLGPIDPALLKSALDKGLRLRKAQGFAGI